MLEVAGKKDEATGFATLYFNHPLPFRPGQFVMLWIPGLDEKPYTLSSVSDRQFGITIEAKGIFSKRAVSLQKGDLVGIRGPFGNGFTLPGPDQTSILVAGGCGMAPLAPLADGLIPGATLIQGARSKEYLLYPDRFDLRHLLCTDDGSIGHKGFVTEILEKELAAGHTVDRVFACGPEIMMYKVYEICRKYKIHCQVSLERYMRCGFGVCGACVCGREVVCTDGPVFGSQKLENMTDFNATALLKSGKAVSLAEYTEWRQS